MVAKAMVTVAEFRIQVPGLPSWSCFGKLPRIELMMRRWYYQASLSSESVSYNILFVHRTTLESPA